MGQISVSGHAEHVLSISVATAVMIDSSQNTHLTNIAISVIAITLENAPNKPAINETVIPGVNASEKSYYAT